MHFLEGTEENHEKPQSGLQVSGPRFDHGTSEYEAGVLTLAEDRDQVSLLLNKAINVKYRSRDRLS
jgi:hypothetical protein